MSEEVERAINWLEDYVEEVAAVYYHLQRDKMQKMLEPAQEKLAELRIFYRDQGMTERQVERIRKVKEIMVKTLSRSKWQTDVDTRGGYSQDQKELEDLCEFMTDTDMWLFRQTGRL